MNIEKNILLRRWRSIILKLVILLSILAPIFGILIFDFAIFGQNPVSHKEWNIFVTTISYSILCGWIIYVLTSMMPFWFGQNIRQPVITRNLYELNWELSLFVEIVSGFKDFDAEDETIEFNGKKIQIIIYSKFPNLLKDVNWDDKFNYGKTESLTNRQQAFKVITKIFKTLTLLSIQNGAYFSRIQNKYINKILEMPVDAEWFFGSIQDIVDRIGFDKILIDVAEPLQHSIGIKA